MKKKAGQSDLFDSIVEEVQEEVAQKRSHKCYIGIDNGVSGSIAILKPTGGGLFMKIPTKSEQNYTKAKGNITRIKGSQLYDILKMHSESWVTHVIIERPMVNPTRFKATTSALRALEAVLIIVDDMLNLPFQYMDSKEWQRVMLPQGLKGPEELKPASLQIGNRLFPQFRDVKHEDRDSLLMAEYARRANL